nr:hypothetical protein CFP56_52569 [Quercus suber]
MLKHHDHSSLCCSTALTSPEPPARPWPGDDGLAGLGDERFRLTGMLAAAALPDGHPHALAASVRKAQCDETIVRSPRIVDKMKMHFRHRARGLPNGKRTSLLSRTSQYDEDAVFMETSKASKGLDSPVASEVDARTPLVEMREPAETEKGQEWMRTSKSRQNPNSYREWQRISLPTAESSGRVSTTCANDGHFPSGIRENNSPSPMDMACLEINTTKGHRPSVCLSNSHTVLTRATAGSNHYTTLCAVRDVHRMQPIQAAGKYGLEHWPQHGELVPGNSLTVDASPWLVAGTDPQPGGQQHTRNDVRQTINLHLHTMDISQQLRSMSQLSDSMDPIAEVSPSPDQPWNFHFQEIPSTGRCSLSKSLQRSMAITHPTGPEHRVKSPAQASSVYSRPSSGLGDPIPPLSLIGCQWPLPPYAAAEEPHDSQSSDNVQHQPASHPAESQRSEKVETSSSVRWLRPTTRTASGSGKSGSSQQSKESRFHELFSPHRKLVRERRSIFQFLRLNNRSKQTRNISSPMLISRRNVVDGPADDPALLTVAYEFPELPSVTAKPRSTSMVSLQMADRRETSLAAALSVETPYPNVIDRRPSMIEYERNLTISGDDRRRPSSSTDVRRPHDIHPEDRHEPVHFRRSLSRANPLGDTPGQLMAQALAKHQDEKALFRSVSKYRESLTQDEPVERVSIHAGSSQVAVNVLAQGAAPVSPTTSTAALQLAQTVRARSGVRRVSKIGTSLASWSRFPSHSRPERCTSAGSADDVIVRDFVPYNHHQTAQRQHDPSSDRKPPKTARAWLKAGLPKSRSSTFGGFVRYYANIFSTGVNQNRRSSVATGGWLEHPDLEMLSPVPHSETHHHHHSLRQHLHELEEAMRVDVEALEAETDKLMHPSHVHHREKSLNAVKMPPAVEVPRAKSPFRLESPFQESYFALPVKRRSMAYGPGDEGLEEDDTAPFKLALEVEAGQLAMELAPPPAPGSLHLDGACEEKPSSPPATLSKASAWADMYKECILRPAPKCSADTNTKALLPQFLMPLKSRSRELPPEQFSKTAVIRRFPSVTVIDDCRGHSRSVSLISIVERGGTGGILRSSTNDLIELIKIREREEREKLLARI